MSNTKIKTPDHNQNLASLMNSLRSDIHSLGAKTLIFRMIFRNLFYRTSFLVENKTNDEDKKYIAIFYAMVLSSFGIAIYFILGIFSIGWSHADYVFFSNSLSMGISAIALTFLVLVSIAFRSTIEFYNKNRDSLSKILSYWILNSFEPQNDIDIRQKTILFIQKKELLVKSDLCVIFATLSIISFGLFRTEEIEIEKLQYESSVLAQSELGSMK